jgi:hypothetical protein
MSPMMTSTMDISMSVNALAAKGIRGFKGLRVPDMAITVSRKY